MDNHRIRQLEKKKIIVNNALQIIEHLERRKYPRWKEFINRKIDTLLSSIWHLYGLGDSDAVRSMMNKIVELEIVRDNPELALGLKALSLEEAIEITNFKRTRLTVTVHEGDIHAVFPIIDPKEKKYSSPEEARRNKVGGQEYAISFKPDISHYKKIVAYHYNKAITVNDVIALVAGAMYFTGFADNEIKHTLSSIFNYSGAIPSHTGLRYVAIVWGNDSPLKPNKATLSIPSEEMAYNQENGIYNIFFSRGYRGVGSKDIEQYNPNCFNNSKYKDFSEIYSAKFHGGDYYPYNIDDFYAIFA